MPKTCTEKLIPLDKCIKFPMDLWSYMINLQKFDVMGPQLVIKNGESVITMESCPLYTVRTRRELLKNGFSRIKVNGNFYVLATSQSKCYAEFVKYCGELIKTVNLNLNKLSKYISTINNKK